MANTINKAEEEQLHVLNLLRGIDGVSVGISWKKTLGYYVKIDTDKGVRKQVETRLRGLNFPIRIENAREVHFD